MADNGGKVGGEKGLEKWREAGQTFPTWPSQVLRQRLGTHATTAPARKWGNGNYQALAGIAPFLRLPRNSELGRKQQGLLGWALVTPKTEKQASALAWQQGRKCRVRTLKNCLPLAHWVTMRKSLSLSEPVYPSEKEGSGLDGFLCPF